MLNYSEKQFENIKLFIELKMIKKINKESIRFKILIPIMLLMLFVLCTTFILLEYYKNIFVADQIKYEGQSIITSITNSLETVESKNQLKKLINKFSTDKKINYIYLFDQTGAIYIGDTNLPEGNNISSLSLNNKDKVDLIIDGFKVKNETHLEFYKNNFELVMIAPVNLNFRMIDNVKLGTLRILVSLNGTSTYNMVRKIILAWEIIYFIAFILVSLLLYLLIRRYVLSPVGDLVAYIKTIKSHKSKMVEATPNIKFQSDELAILGTTLFTQVKELNEKQQDIVEQNQKLFEINEKLQEATITKQTFLANMSHEIRTPLSGIIGVGELLAETNLDERQKNYSSILQHSSKSLLGIVNDILDFSLIEAKKITFENRVFKLSDLIKDIFNSFNILATKKGVHLEIDVNEINNINVSTDSLRITQVLNNLISNSLKFTDQGKVKIFVSKNNGPKKGNFLFTIQDSGIGMTAEQLEKLFRPFEQTDGSITRKFGGTGLGLVISKNIVELLGGEIWVESRQAVGTTFYFTLDIPITENTVLKTSTDIEIVNEIISSVKVLIVDDNDVNRLVARTFLAKRFSNVSEEVDGQSAYEFYTKEQPQIIFMDLQMPNLDGVSSMKLIREYEIKNSLKASIVVALTANAVAEEKETALKSGFNFYLTKPLNRKILNSLIDEIIKDL